VSSFISFDNPGVIVTALKTAENANAVVVRGYNPAPEGIEVGITVPGNTASVTRITLEEKPLGDLTLAKNKAAFTVGKGEIVSLLIKTK
jgi:alpha-mannosidase